MSQQSSTVTGVSRAERSLAAEAAFRARLAELGATLLETAWLGSGSPHHIRCSAGHDGYPRPNSVQKGGGVCAACAKHDPAASEQAFHARLLEMGATLLEPYVDTKTRLHVRCAEGHDCRVRPIGLTVGYGLCAKCSVPARSRRSVAAEAAFRARLAELGATLLEPEWLGVDRPHRAKCALGHGCLPRPSSVGQGVGICAACAGNDSAYAEAEFRVRLAALGAELLEPAWLGKDRKHHVRCSAGHDSWPQPGNVRAGAGICRQCAGKAWDAFYVVQHEHEPWVKFGITSGDAQRRLSVHRKGGYTTMVRLFYGLADTTAPDAEDAVRKALKDAGEEPIRGREYFDISCLALILDVADSWLAVSDAPAAVSRPAGGQLAFAF